MYATYGAYQFDADRLSWVFREEAKLDSSGVPFAYTPRYDLNYYCAVPDTGNNAADQLALTAKLDALRAALLVPYQDFTIYDNGGQPIYRPLRNNDTVGGVKVLALPSFPRGTRDAGFYTTFVEVEFSIGAETTAPAAGGGNNPVIRWSESVTFIGNGGPRWVSQTMIEGPPRGEQTAQQTPIKCVQEGQGTGYSTWLNFPPPLFDARYEHGEMRQRRKMTPTNKVGGVSTEYPMSWQYHFEFNGEQALPDLVRP